MCDGWADASLQYMSSGGFAVSAKVPSINQETLVLWGRQDKILDPKLYAERYASIRVELNKCLSRPDWIESD